MLLILGPHIRRQLWASQPRPWARAAHAASAMPRRMRSRKDVIADLGSRPVTAISLQDLFKYSRVDTPEWQVVANGNYMRRELPVRFAQRALELDPAGFRRYAAERH